MLFVLYLRSQLTVMSIDDVSVAVESYRSRTGITRHIDIEQ